MCMLYREDGSFLVELRKKNDWPGLNFPGGHIEPSESVPSSVRREMKEETGLEVGELTPCGYYEWNVPNEETRHLALLFRSGDFSGELKSSDEGPVFWIKENEVRSYPLSQDFEDILKLMRLGLHSK